MSRILNGRDKSAVRIKNRKNGTQSANNHIQRRKLV